MFFMKPDALVMDLRKERSPLETQGARKRFLINVSSNAALLSAQVGVTLWLTPFLIGHLGIAAFGMVLLVNSLVSYMSFLSNALDSVINRFLAIDLNTGDTFAANKTFNTALFGIVGIILVLFPLVFAISLAFPNLFHVPLGWENDARLLLFLAAFAFFIQLIGSVFVVSPFVHSKFLLKNTGDLAGLFARISFILIMFSLLRPHMWYAGGGMLVGVVVALFGYIIVWRKLTPELHIQITAFDRSLLPDFVGMGGWVIVNSVGVILLSRVDLIVVNAYFGAALTGGYGAVAQFSLFMGYLVNALGSVMRPVVLTKYAQRDFVGLQSLGSQGVKLFGLVLALPVGLLCGFSRPILSVWLGPSYEYLSILLVLIVCHQSLNLSVRPLSQIQNAYNKVRWPGIATLLSGGVSLGLGVLLAMWGRWGAAGVAVAVGVTWTAKNAVYMPIYTACIMKLPWWTFLPRLGCSIIGTLFVGMVSFGFTFIQMPNSLLTLAGFFAVVSLLYAVLVWAIGLTPVDRQLVKSLSPLQITKIRASYRQES